MSKKTQEPFPNRLALVRSVGDSMFGPFVMLTSRDDIAKHRARYPRAEIMAYEQRGPVAVTITVDGFDADKQPG